MAEEPKAPNDPKARKSRSFVSFLVILTLLVASLAYVGSSELTAPKKLSQDQYLHYLYTGRVERQEFRGKIVAGRITDGTSDGMPFEVQFDNISDREREFRRLKAERPHRPIMVDHFSRALAAGAHVGGAQIGDHVDAGGRGEAGAITDLASEAEMGAVEKGMAVKADHPRRRRSLGEQRRHRLGVAIGHQPPGLGDRHRVTGIEAAQARPQRHVIGDGQRRAGLHPGLAVGEHKRGVDAVGRSAAHQPYGAHPRHPPI